jgi:hypothetical protein
MQKVIGRARRKMPLEALFTSGRRLIKPRGERNRNETVCYGRADSEAVF